MAVVLTLVQTKQIRINVHKRNNTKNTVQTIQNTVNTSTHITKTPTQLPKHTHIHTPTHNETSQEMPHILWKPKVHYHMHKRPPPFAILRQIVLVHCPVPLLEDIFKYYPSIYACVFQVASFPRYVHQNPVYTFPFPHTCHMPCPSCSSFFDHPNNIYWAVHIIKLLIM